MPTTQPPRAKFTRRSFLKIAGTAGMAAGAGRLLAACAPQAAGPAATSTPLPPFKLGLLVPYSDIYAVLGESITEAMKMYFDGISNTAGGRKIEIVAEDEGTQPEPALEKARKLVEQDKVDMVAGIVSSGVANALRDYFDESQKILIIANAGANPLTRDRKSKYIFRTSFSNWQPNWPLGSWAYANVGKRAFISVPDYAAGHDMESAFLNSFLAAGGQVVGKPQYTPFPNMGDPAPFITEIQAANPDLVFAFYSGGAAVNFVKAYGDFGLTGKIPFVCAGFAVEEDVLPAQGQAALGAKSGLHWALLLDNPENKAFTAAYKQRTNKDANTFAVQGYDTAHVIADALNAVQGDTSNADRLIEAIAGVSFNGPRGAFKFDPVTHNIIQHIYIRNVQEVDGVLHNVVLEDAGEVADPGDNSKG